MTKHTPGPWTVVDGVYPSFKEVSGPSFKVSAVMWATDLTEDDYSKRTSDLHLIAAAPELLEALKSMESRFGNEMSRHELQPTTYGCNHRAETCPLCEGLVTGWKAVQAARAAIAKATGGAA